MHETKPPSPSPDPFDGAIYDVAVIGGGVVGCAVLRELSRFDLRICLLEKESDLAEGISKANSGVIHAGFNVPPGSLKARLNVEGLGLIYGLAARLGVPHRLTGKLVVALSEGDFPRLGELLAQGERSGVPGLEIVDRAGIERLAPGVRGLRALLSARTGIISPYELTIALAESAVANGAAVALDAPVTSVGCRTDGFRLTTPRDVVTARRVVNAAGLFADEVAALAGIEGYCVFPFRGEYLIADREAGAALSMPVYPVPPRDDSYLGVHITPTLEGNVLLGPSSEAVGDKRDTASTRAVMDKLKAEAFDLVPSLRRFPFIHSYAGLRPKLIAPGGASLMADFVIEESGRRPGWINLLGIESPGLTAAPAIARRVVEMIGAHRDLAEKSDFKPDRPAPPDFSRLDDAERAAHAAADPKWGEMVCRCEHVTRAEVEAALRNPFGVRTMDGLKRRTRCGMGRCQGGFCGPRIVEILQKEGVPLDRISKRGGESRMFFGRIKP
ncbi:MAG: NAD(P)/FAD-dependent oxidoreductase [Candidatus Aminicenantes bacterium]|nr:NAD(P)/FAD-dependent oxidoreductase [Candidatus Aminicenantes bacterium]